MCHGTWIADRERAIRANAEEFFAPRRTVRFLLAGCERVYADYLAKISSVKVLGMIDGRGRGLSAVGAGAGPRSAVTV